MPALLICSLLVVSLTQSSPVELTAAVDQYRNAIVKADRATLAALLHDDFVITSGDGQARDKAGELADLVADGFTVHEFRLDEPRYRVYGSTGVATGILRWSMTFNGRASSVERRTTMTWAKQGDRWQMVAQHVARVK
jgi:ketosteroid isomerase-like protein